MNRELGDLQNTLRDHRCWVPNQLRSLGSARRWVDIMKKDQRANDSNYNSRNCQERVHPLGMISCYVIDIAHFRFLFCDDDVNNEGKTHHGHRIKAISGRG